MDGRSTYTGGKRKQGPSSQHTEYPMLLYRRTLINHSDSTQSDNTIATVHGLLPHLSVSPANWLVDLFDPNHGDVRQLLFPSLL
ncbi:hypothetical protein D915_010618 [Fasciola hepatica]|uniref:Uncharacterized protein n=1 Tax=Fasciola hepatica TaxID=6192 RepID=A0A4E0QUT0_FASHE|nr:hypothetical protein D915_010618 [Fasciola hepatica]